MAYFEVKLGDYKALLPVQDAGGYWVIDYPDLRYRLRALDKSTENGLGPVLDYCRLSLNNQKYPFLYTISGRRHQMWPGDSWKFTVNMETRGLVGEELTSRGYRFLNFSVLDECTSKRVEARVSNGFETTRHVCVFSEAQWEDMGSFRCKELTAQALLHNLPPESPRRSQLRRNRDMFSERYGVGTFQIRDWPAAVELRAAEASIDMDAFYRHMYLGFSGTNTGRISASGALNFPGGQSSQDELAQALRESLLRVAPEPDNRPIHQIPRRSGQSLADLIRRRR